MIDREEALRRLAVCRRGDDTEVDHADADGVLCDLLVSLGYRDVVDSYNEVHKWYA